VVTEAVSSSPPYMAGERPLPISTKFHYFTSGRWSIYFTDMKLYRHVWGDIAVV